MISDTSDYRQLTHSYMDVFDSQSFYHFLNTTQTGSAHTSSGTELSILLKGVGTALILCLIQFMIFCLLRGSVKDLYQPRSYCVPVEERVSPLPRGLFGWIIPTFSYQVQYYLSLGLDAYFFIRYINILLLFFVVTGSLNMLVLIPINVTGSDSSYSASGMDVLSLSNISDSNVHRLNAHFIMALMTIGTFHWLIMYELKSFIKIKQRYLLTSKHRNSISSTVVVIKDVPQKFLTFRAVQDLFQIIPGGVHSVWLVHDHRRIHHLQTQAARVVDILEADTIRLLRKIHCCRSSPRPQFYPPISIRVYSNLFGQSFSINLPGFLRFLQWRQKIDKIDWYVKKLQRLEKLIEEQRLLLAQGQLEKFNSIIIRFNSQAGAHIVNQCLLFPKQGHLDKTLIEVNPDDIKWNNLARNTQFAPLLTKYIVTLIFISLIILYIIPVSFIGLFSQIPLMTQLFPFLNWVYGLPEEVRDIISSLLPSLALSLLTDVSVKLFRFLIQFKGKLTGAEIEVDYQKWNFAFLFIQQFVVVTVSSSVTVILKQIVDQPTSIPVMLATNLPKAATFFYHYILVKAFAFCGSNFLRIPKLLKYLTWNIIQDTTPRRKFNRVTTLPKIYWGSVYPVYSVYASIGICYCIISPLICVFVVFILVLALLYYKYSLRFIYSHINESDTLGRLYPRALLHLYMGIYCLEGCLLGIFLLSKNGQGQFCMRVHGLAMFVVILATIFSNITFYRRYRGYFSNIPILSNSNSSESIPLDFSGSLKSNVSMLYLHPSFKYEVPKIWIPDDSEGLAHQESEKFKCQGVDACVTAGARVEFGRLLNKTKIIVTDAPPDYK